MPTFPGLQRLTTALAVAALAATACGGRGSESAATSEAGPLPTAAAAALADSDSSSGSDEVTSGIPVDSPVVPPAPSLQFGTPLDTALDIPSAERNALPVGLQYPALGVELAPIDAVGVESNGEMEIPGAEAVGWYQYGPSPGEAGSAVLAAHIAYNGVDGVFRDLVGSEVDDVFTVVFDDGSERDYRVVERAQYDKTALPFDRVFARTGSPVVTLISCGGDFQRSLSSYQDNIVAYAVPVESPGDSG